jgi:hypothetical protein
MSGLVEAVVWLGWTLGLQGSEFVVVTFVCSAAVAGYHFLAALAVGIFSACVIGILFGIFPASEPNGYSLLFVPLHPIMVLAVITGFGRKSG